ncbi:MAG TPA: hypothetical protein VM121_00585, partial [Acidimicrobiales bacterium]|nr:hypothetical protein [Acidimicrobiales bacterium]
MAERGYATSTIDRNWNYLNQALQHGVRHRTIKTNPAADVLLPEKRPGKTRKSLSVEQMKRLVLETIPADPRAAMWLTGLMCGLRPGELAGLRWPLVDIDSDSPSIHVVERARSRGPLRGPGRAEDAPQQGPHRPPPAARRRPPEAP